MVVKGKTLTLKEHWQKLMDELRPMTPKKRLEHLWEYYKWVLGVLVIIGFIVALVVTSLINLNTEVLVSGVLMNCDVDPEGFDYLSEGYYQTHKTEGKRQRVDITYRNYDDPETSEDPAFNYDALQSIMAMVAASALDYIMADDVGMEAMLMPDFWMDLRELFTEEELAQMDDRVIKLVVEETGEVIPMALNITDSEFCKTYMASEKGSTYIMFSITTPRPEACREMYERIMVLEEVPHAQ